MFVFEKISDLAIARLELDCKNTGEELSLQYSFANFTLTDLGQHKCKIGVKKDRTAN